MCGITAIFYKDKNPDHEEIKNINRVITHRGPDGEGYYLAKNFAFGHRRLAIIDLTPSGYQPMHYKGKNSEYVIIYNGEIYNYLELKEELLSHGYNFNTNTDTEVILASYDKWGIDALNKFNGMWVFILYDKLNEEFFISRDRFGIKPLYYYKNNNLIIFASEIKSIIAHPDVITSPNKDYLMDYIKNGPKEYIKETAFKNIYRFNFASYFKGNLENIFKNFNEKNFWKLSVNLSDEVFDEKKAKEYSKKYYELLKDSVRLRLRADVKVGSALSGGLDSSSIVYLINEILREQEKDDMQETFSSVYKTPGTQNCDESNYINLLSKTLNVNSNQIEPQESQIPKELKKLIYIFDNPPEGTCMSGWHTFKKVKEKGVKVTLDGQGADEQLGGYFRYILTYLVNLTLKDLIKEIIAFFKIPNINKKILFKGFVLNILIKIFGKNFIKKIFNNIFKRDIVLNLNEELKNDISTYLVNLLHYSDRVSMAHSIESRVPFLDYRLVEFLANIPACYKIHNGWTKYIARLAFDGKLPNSITWRKDKMGWPIPHEHWFRGNLKSWFISTIKSCKFIKDIFPEFDIDKKINSNVVIEHLIRYLNISIWFKIFFEKNEKKS